MLVCPNVRGNRDGETDADAEAMQTPYRSYERHKKLQLRYNKLSLCTRVRAAFVREPARKGENDSRRGEFIRHFPRARTRGRGDVNSRGSAVPRGATASCAIYRRVKAKVPIIGAFKGS